MASRGRAALLSVVHCARPDEFPVICLVEWLPGCESYLRRKKCGPSSLMMVDFGSTVSFIAAKLRVQAGPAHKPARVYFGRISRTTASYTINKKARLQLSHVDEGARSCSSVIGRVLNKNLDVSTRSKKPWSILFCPTCRRFWHIIGDFSNSERRTWHHQKHSRPRLSRYYEY